MGLAYDTFDDDRVSDHSFVMCRIVAPHRSGTIQGSTIGARIPRLRPSPRRGALRIIDHPLSRPYVDYANWYEPSDVYGHRLVPNFEGFGLLNVHVTINSHGFRDREHAWEKENGTIRILGLGDSFTFGWGVASEETFLKQLELLLQQRTGMPVETINAGVPGWGLNQYYLFLKKAGIRYAPDVVVLAYFTDDLNGPIQEAIPANEQYRRGLQFKGGGPALFPSVQLHQIA